MKQYAKLYTGCLTTIICILMLFAAGNVRAETTSVTYEVTYQQTSAREVFAMVNRLRTGGSWCWNEENTKQVETGKLPALTYDYDLEKVAMQRAAELAIYYSHTRPDGSGCETAVNTYTAYGENIAAGWG